MKIIQSDIVIVGAGLTGLAIAYYLKEQGIQAVLVEARDRIGGRIHTRYLEGQAPLEMGATWLGKKHSALTNLLTTLNIEIFVQELGDRAIYEPISTSPPQLVSLPPNDEPSYRIQGGSSKLINALAEKLNEDQIYTTQAVQSIKQINGGLQVKSNNYIFEASQVISTLPPYLLTSTIALQSGWPAELLEVAQQTHTWMGESIKVALTYKSPFWRAKNLSGTIFSNVGPIPEMYDHSNIEDSLFSLKGFFNGNYFSVSKAERLELVLKQLQKYFGAQANDYITYEETVWRNEPFTFAAYDSHILPHQNNGHSIYQKTFMDDRLIIAGSETAQEFPGYMEGAISSAKSVLSRINTNA